MRRLMQGTLQATRRMAVGADRAKADTWLAEPVGSIGLVKEGHPVAALDQFDGEGLQGLEVAVVGRRDDGEMGHA